MLHLTTIIPLEGMWHRGAISDWNGFRFCLVDNNTFDRISAEEWLIGSLFCVMLSDFAR